jgi:glyoxylase-like metal-dependent hydrolase (beta-lactamase superfamily II)
MGSMILDSLVVGPIQANCYILGCPETGEALLVDPGDDADRIVKRLARHGLTPVAYFHTHGHLDHVGGTAGLRPRFGGRILLHPADQFLYERAREHALEFGFEIPEPLPVDHFVADGEEIRWGKLAGRVRHTPGHSPGGVCLIVPGEAGSDARAFTGDTLFAGSVGRTDLPGGAMAQLLRSIREQLLTLPDGTTVASGHGPLTTIGEERRRNPFLQEGW